MGHERLSAGRCARRAFSVVFCKCFAFKNLQGLVVSHINILYITWRSIVCLAAVMIKSIQLLQNTEILTAMENIWKPLFYFPPVKCNGISFVAFRATAALRKGQITWPLQRQPKGNFVRTLSLPLVCQFKIQHAPPRDSCKCFRKQPKHEFRHHRRRGASLQSENQSRGMSPNLYIDRFSSPILWRQEVQTQRLLQCERKYGDFCQ